MRCCALACLLLSGCFASAHGERGCELFPDSCDELRERWEQTYGPLSRKCDRRLNDIAVRFIHWSELKAQCSGSGNVYTTCGCAWFDRELGDKVLGRDPVWYAAITTDTSNPEDVLIHEGWHHMESCEHRTFDRPHRRFPDDLIGVCRLESDTDRPEPP